MTVVKRLVLKILTVKNETLVNPGVMLPHGAALMHVMPSGQIGKTDLVLQYEAEYDDNKEKG